MFGKNKSIQPGQTHVSFDKARKIKKTVTLTGAEIMSLQNMTVHIVKNGRLHEIGMMGNPNDLADILEKNSKWTIEILKKCGANVDEALSVKIDNNGKVTKKDV